MQFVRRLCLVAVAASCSLLASTVPTASADAQSSTTGVDARWGRSGVVLLTIPGQSRVLNPKSVQIADTTYVGLSGPEGAIVTALDAQGRLLRSFADSGRLVLPQLAVPGSMASLVDDGRGGLLVSSWVGSDPVKLALRRIDLATAQLDGAFGENGQFIADNHTAVPVVDSLGRIYVPTRSFGNWVTSVVRLTPDGRLDSTWPADSATPGRREVPEAGLVERLHVDSQDRLVVSGGARDDFGLGYGAVVRILPDGSNDPDFALTRTAEYTWGTVRSGDGLVTFSHASSGCGYDIRRYDAFGGPDGAFGESGRVGLRYGDYANCTWMRDATSDSSGRVTALMVVRVPEGEASVMVRLGVTGAIESEVVLGVEPFEGLTPGPTVDPYGQLDLAPDGRTLVTGLAQWSGQTVAVVSALTANADAHLPPPLQAQPFAAGREVEDACPAGRVRPAGFEDVAAGASHATSVDCVVWWKVAGGRSATLYAPAAPVTRAQMATFIANAIEKSGDFLPEPSRDWFDDDNGLNHERNINRLAEAGVIAGRAPGVYAPQAPVSRGAMAKFLAMSYEYTSLEELPTHVDYFTDDTGHALESFVNMAASVGLAAGSGAGYAPGGDVRRDQMSTFIARWLDLVVERHSALLPDEG